MNPLPRHQCLVYEGAPSRNLGGIAQLLIKNLMTNRRCIYLNSPAMVTGMRCRLYAEGLNVTELMEKGDLVLSSDREHLVDGKFDGVKMLKLLEDTLQETLAGGYAGLWATGDMTWEFGSENNLDKLLEYELGLEEFMQENPAMSGICQYHRNTLPTHAIATALGVHKAVYINETLSRVNPNHRYRELIRA